MKTTIKTSLCISGEAPFETVYLIVVPNVGETLSVDNEFYTVIHRAFHLQTMREGVKKCGYTQSCVLTLDKLDLFK